MRGLQVGGQNRMYLRELLLEEECCAKRGTIRGRHATANALEPADSRRDARCGCHRTDRTDPSDQTGKRKIFVMLNPKRRLGRTGLEVTQFSLGGAGIGMRAVTDEGAIETVRQALQAGINYVDTSPLYGESERRVGLALQGVPRGDYVLSTKTGTHPERRGDYSWDGTHWSVENSLRLLKTDRIDLLLVHDPRDEADMEAIFGPRGALEALESLKAQGVIGAVGLGQRNHDWHRRAILSGRFDAILTYNDYHPIRTTALTGGLLELAETARRRRHQRLTPRAWTAQRPGAV